MFGSRISTVAFPMLVLNLYNSPFFTGLVAFAAIAPSLLFYMPAAVLVDRLNPRKVMLISESLRGVAIFSVVFSLLAWERRTWLAFIIVAMVAEEILEIFSTLADRRYLSRLVEHDKVASRQASIEVRTHAVVLAGRPVGPFLFSINMYLPFLADALSFIFSIISLLLVRRGSEPRDKLPRKRLRELVGDTRQGLAWLREDRRAFSIVIFMAITSLVAQALILMLLAEAHAKELSTLTVGFVLAASGVGGAAGSMLAKFLPRMVIGSPGMTDFLKSSWLTIELLAWSLALAALTFSGGQSAFYSTAAMFILGFAGAMGNIKFGTYLFKRVPDDMIAKVTGFGQMVAIAAAAIGPVLGGAAIHYFGIRGAVFLLFLIMLFMAMSSFFVPDSGTQEAEPGLRAVPDESPTGPTGDSGTDSHDMPDEHDMPDDMRNASPTPEISAVRGPAVNLS
jgi:MFS family permease